MADVQGAEPQQLDLLAEALLQRAQAAFCEAGRPDLAASLWVEDDCLPHNDWQRRLDERPRCAVQGPPYVRPFPGAP